MIIEYCIAIIILVIFTQLYFYMNTKTINNFSNIWSSVENNEYRFRIKNFNKSIYKEWREYIEDVKYDKKTKLILNISIDGIEKSHDKIRGVKNSFKNL